MPKKKITSITHCGREITAQELEDIKETVSMFQRLSRVELAQTIAENLQWYRASGTNKVDASLKLLEKLESQGFLKLPEKRIKSKYTIKKKILITDKTEPQPEISCKLNKLYPVELEIVKDKDIAALWKEYVSRYHYLGYNKPFGYTLRYFIKSELGRLGCVLFSGAAKSMGTRDSWIGWTEKQRLNNLAWVINNSRFLIFPWVRVQNLASHVFGQINRQISAHWQESWGYSPVLMETFVDPVHYRGTCYNAANWQYLGLTTGQGLLRKGKSYSTTPKKILVKPLTKNFRDLLCSEKLVGRMI
jgi:DNA-binding PadR family transcriptional regulator